MTFLPFTQSWCYREGWDFSGWITWFVYSLPLVIWYLLEGLAWYSRDTYVQLLSNTYWITSAVNVIILEIVKQPRPHPDCNNQSNGMPSYEIQLSYHFLLIMLVHRLFWLRAVGAMDLLRGIAMGLLIPFWIVWMGNYSWDQALIAAVVGLCTGLFSVQAIYLFWLDRFSVLTAHPLLSAWGFRHSLSAFYSDRDLSGTRPYAEPPNEIVNPFMVNSPEASTSRLMYPIQVPGTLEDAVRTYVTAPPKAPRPKSAPPAKRRSSKQATIASNLNSAPVRVGSWDTTAELIQTLLLGGSTFPSGQQKSADSPA